MKRFKKNFSITFGLLCALSMGTGLVACNGDSAENNPPIDNNPPVVGYEAISFENQTCAVKLISSTLTRVEIPESVENNKVVSIIANETAEVPELKEIALPNTITTIGEKAFYGYENLQKITLGKDTRSIFTFNGAPLIQNAEITVGKDAFTNTALPAISASATGEGSLVNLQFAHWSTQDKIQLSTALNAQTDQIYQSEAEIRPDAQGNAEATVDFGTYGLFERIDFSFYGEERFFKRAELQLRQANIILLT